MSSVHESIWAAEEMHLPANWELILHEEATYSVTANVKQVLDIDFLTFASSLLQSLGWFWFGWVFFLFVFYLEEIFSDLQNTTRA